MTKKKKQHTTRAAIPGKTIINGGNSFRKPAANEAPFACRMVLQAIIRCAISWSMHQYHIDPKCIKNVLFYQLIFTYPKLDQKTFQTTQNRRYSELHAEIQLNQPD